jgi:hypothetical protein
MSRGSPKTGSRRSAAADSRQKTGSVDVRSTARTRARYLSHGVSARHSAAGAYTPALMR